MLLKKFITLRVGVITALMLSGCNDQPPAFDETPAALDSGDLEAQVLEGSIFDEGILPGGVESLSQSFIASSQLQGEVKTEIDPDFVNLYLTMGPGNQGQAVEYRQDERPKLTDTYFQGAVEKQGSESFSQSSSATGPLDILIVMDNSGSMKQEQANLSTKLSKLLTYVADSNWRISVVTTDPADGCGQHIVTKGDPDVETAFADAITRGIEGSGNERGILQAVNGLSCDGGSWLRPNSTLATLIVSDEDNCSDGTKCNGQAWQSADYLIDHLKTIRVPGVNARVYGLIWHPDDNSCTDALRQATVYGEAIQKGGGSYGAICDADYSSTLEQISQNLSNILNTQFTIQYPAVQGSEQVFINGSHKTSGYSLKGNVISFDSPPPADATIKVAYNYNIPDPKSSFTLGYAGDVDDLEVYLDGKILQSSAYGLSKDGDNTKVDFDKAPEGRELTMQYRPKMDLTSLFPVISGLDTGGIKVSINGLEVTDFSFENGNIGFPSPPADGSNIRIEYPAQSGPVYHYPLYVPGDLIGALDVSDSETGEAVPYTVEGDQMVFAPEDYEEGRTIRLRYPNPNPASKALNVARPILVDEDLTVESGGVECTSFEVVGESTIDFTSCGFGHEALVYVSFWYQGEVPLRYPVLPEALGEATDKFDWEVFLNGEAVGKYVVQDGWIIFDSGINEGDAIEVVVSVTQEDS